MTKYFRIPFADSGDKVQVPDLQQDSSVCYQTGYTSQYEIDPRLKTGGRYIERKQFNYIMHDITENLKQWQEKTYPDWIADCGTGNPFSYNKNAVVRYGGKNYLSLSSNNNKEPDDAKSGWVNLDSIDYLLIGTPIPYPCKFNKIPNGYLPLSGQPISKSDYPILYSIYGDYLPDMRDRFMKGTSIDGNPNEFENGSIPSHSHSGNTDDAGSHTHDMGYKNEGCVTIAGSFETCVSRPYWNKYHAYGGLFLNMMGAFEKGDEWVQNCFAMTGTNNYKQGTKSSREMTFNAQPASRSGSNDDDHVGITGTTGTFGLHDHSFKTSEFGNGDKNIVDNISFTWIVRAC